MLPKKRMINSIVVLAALQNGICPVAMAFSSGLSPMVQDGSLRWNLTSLTKPAKTFTIYGHINIYLKKAIRWHVGLIFRFPALFTTQNLPFLPMSVRFLNLKQSLKQPFILAGKMMHMAKGSIILMR